MTKMPLGLLVIASLCAASCAAPSTGNSVGIAPIAAPPHSASDEAIFAQRLADYLVAVQTLGRVGNYDPVEPIIGAEQVQPLPLQAEPTIPAAAIQQALDYVEARRTSAFLIAHRGELVVEQYFGDFERDTPLVSKAMAKQLAALAIGRAIAMGHINSLDQPVADFITEWQSDPVKSRILVRHLLDHRSGLLPQDFGPGAPPVLTRALLHPRHGSVLVHEYPATHEPGTRFEYSNANFELVAIVIERATGRRYTEFVGSEVLARIGAEGGTVWVNRPGGLAHSGCCMMLPAQSWLRLGLLIHRGGSWDGEQLIDPAFIQAMRTGTAQNPYYGAGLYVAGPYVERRGYLHPSIEVGKVLHSEPYLDGDIALFDGNGNQVLYLIPSMDLVVLRMGERPTQDREWDNAFLPNLLIRAILQQTGGTAPKPQQR